MTRAPGDRNTSGAAAPAVSVICTARNAAPTIAATLESILAQDMPDWEMIVVDDGSTDDTAAVVRRYADADRRIRLVTTGGIGRGRALNLAMTEAEADLVANIDADDESHPERLRRQLEAIARHPEFAVLCTQVVTVYDADRPIWPAIGTGGTAAVQDVTKDLALSNPVCHSSVIMRRPAIVRAGGYEEGRRFVLDYDLWVRCATAGFRLAKLQMPLAAKRLHAGQHFLHTARLRYLLASLRVQARGMRTVGVKAWHLPVIALRFVWLILPPGVRHAVGRLRERRRVGRPSQHGKPGKQTE